MRYEKQSRVRQESHSRSRPAPPKLPSPIYMKCSAKAAVLTCVTHEHGSANLMPGAALWGHLKHTALEGSTMPVKEQG